MQLTILQAMGKMEGFGVLGSRPTKNNNPLDLTYCSESVSFGATGTDGRFAVFPDEETGWNAGRRWLSIPAKFDVHGNLIAGYLGATLEQVINRFAPPNENNSNEYVSNVSLWTGVKPKDVVTKENLG